MNENLRRAMISFEGLAVGDAFGQQFFTSAAEMMIQHRALKPPPWEWTDDTAMAAAIVSVLRQKGEIDADLLARGFADSYSKDSGRGYGPLMHRVLMEIGDSESWEDAAGRVHDGEGSLGNGGAMRAGPVGAFFSEDLNQVVEQSRRSAEVTHSHPEGQAGAIAVAVASALSFESVGEEIDSRRKKIIDGCLALTPKGHVHSGLEKAVALDLDYSPQTAAAALGNGTMVRADDTVPYAIWCALRHLDNYEEAMWATVSGLGDRDTTCAIVGSIVVAIGGIESIPTDWRTSVETRPGIS